MGFDDPLAISRADPFERIPSDQLPCGRTEQLRGRLVEVNEAPPLDAVDADEGLFDDGMEDFSAVSLQLEGHVPGAEQDLDSDPEFVLLDRDEEHLIEPLP